MVNNFQSNLIEFRKRKISSQNFQNKGQKIGKRIISDRFKKKL